MATTDSAEPAEAIKNLALTVAQNLQDQHDWTQLEICDTLNDRPLIRGLPPKRLYTHPDDQIEALEHQHNTGERLFQDPELEWILAVHVVEKWTLKGFSAIFDSIQHNGPREKRVVLATVHNDSTVVYYLMHEGIVKPRQN